MPKCNVLFNQWTGKPLKETFGGKPIVDVNGKPMFAELAIFEQFIDDGWQSRWIETYGKGKLNPIYLMNWIDDRYKNQVHKPIFDREVQSLLSKIASENNNSYSGCWDVVSWKNDRIMFSESKRNKKDFVRSTQTKWLKASLKCGLSISNFLMVQWDIKQ